MRVNRFLLLLTIVGVATLAGCSKGEPSPTSAGVPAAKTKPHPGLPSDLTLQGGGLFYRIRGCTTLEQLQERFKIPGSMKSVGVISQWDQQDASRGFGENGWVGNVTEAGTGPEVFAPDAPRRTWLVLAVHTGSCYAPFHANG